MKIPQINSLHLNCAVDYAFKSGKRVLKEAKKCVDHAGSKSRKALATAVFVSGSLTLQNANKSSAIVQRLDRDIFVRTSMYLSNRTMKVPVIKSAKDVLLSDNRYENFDKDINTRFNKLLLSRKAGKNPLNNKAGVFFEKADKYEVNPVLLMSIAMTESARGTSKASIIKNNIGGIMGRRGLRRFEKVDDCIDVMAQTISNHHNKRNINTLEELAYSGKYCDKSVADKWIKNVMFYVKKLS